MLNNFVEISQLQSPPRARLKLIPALLLKAGFGMSAFGRLPDRAYLEWVFEVNGLAPNMRGALDHVKGPADVVLEAWERQRKEREAKAERVSQLIARLKPRAIVLPQG